MNLETIFEVTLTVLTSLLMPEPVESPVESEVSYTLELPPIQQEGIASFYGAGEKGMHNDTTATGEKFRPKDQTCASRTLPLHSVVIVEDLYTGNWTYCRVNDRGPYGATLYDRVGGGWAAMFKRKRGYKIKRRVDGEWQEAQWFKRRPGKYRGIMDMSYGTAKALGVNLKKGLNPIRVRYWPGNPRYGHSPMLLPNPPQAPHTSVQAPVCGNP